MGFENLVRPLDVKAIEEDGVFTGYASVFGKVDCQNESVESGAFMKSLEKRRKGEGMPAMLWMHDPTQPIGVWIELKEDRNGLSVKGKLAIRTQRGSEAYELLKMKALTGMSIGYRVVKSHYDVKRKARILTEVDLFEISLVTFPANEAARVADVKKREQTDDDVTRAIVVRLGETARYLKA